MTVMLPPAQLFKQYSPTRSEKDSGSPESQVALLSARIQHLTEHLRVHKKDHNSLQRGMRRMVGRRTRLLKYLQREDSSRYQAICQQLGLSLRRQQG